MKSNTDKCNLLVSTNNAINIKIGNIDEIEKLLGVKFDYKLTFHDHNSELCKKASRKIHASSWTHSLNHNLTIALLYECHSRANNSKINRLHERCLRIIYSDKHSLFEELLEKDGSVSIHQRNLQLLATEMYKVRKGLSPAIIT